MDSKNTLEVYGPKIWHVIHTFAANYNPSQRTNFQLFIMSVSDLIPCKVCREHFKLNLKKHPLEKFLINKQSLFLWSYLMHNEVNELQGKESPDYRTCAKYYLGTCSSCPIKITTYPVFPDEWMTNCKKKRFMWISVPVKR